MKAVVVGRGRVGTALGRWLGVKPQREIGIADGPVTVLVAIPDDALQPWARALAPRRRDWGGWTFIHTSGARSSNVFQPLHRRGAASGSMHPMMTFPPRGNPVVSKGVLFTLEGDRAACAAARRLVRAWRGRVLELTAEQKSALHFAATLVGPGAVAAFAAAELVLRQSGLRASQRAAARRGLLDLLEATAANLSQGTSSAWTGALARGDQRTVGLHRKIAASTSLARTYSAMSATARRLLPTPT